MCRDCGEAVLDPSPRRSDICLRCWGVRLATIKAVEMKDMPLPDFANYQRPGRRTKRLKLMGYGFLIESQNAAREKRGEGKI